MRSLRGYHLLFGVALAALVGLGAWWSVYLRHSVDLERKAGLSELVHVAVVTSLLLGQADAPPPVGPLAGESRLEVIPASRHADGDLFSPLIPRYPNLGVRPRPDLIAGIEARAGRRQLMFVGEGTLLVVLIGACTVMFFSLVSSDRRQMRIMDDFVSTVTHEMKTPLTGVASLLETFAAGKVPPEEEAALYAMGLMEVERLEHMVENVLISGKLRTERYHVENEPVALRGRLEAFIAHRRPSLAGRPRSLLFVWEPAEADLTVRADPDALRVVLDNLTDNALKYGGEEPVVTVRVRRHAAAVEVAVEDRGIGFAPTQAESLFTPYYRATAAGRSAHHGTGLGLSISRALARRMGGSLRAESAGPGTGSRFIVTLAEA
ncbi:MAG: sensor histidine kinase [Spirochaetia bacterium]